MKNTAPVLLLVLATAALCSCAAPPRHAAYRSDEVGPPLASVWRFLANGYDRDLRGPRIAADYERGDLHFEQRTLQSPDLHTDSAQGASHWASSHWASSWTDQMWRCMRWSTPALMPIPSTARAIACSCCGLAADDPSARTATR